MFIKATWEPLNAKPCLLTLTIWQQHCLGITKIVYLLPFSIKKAKVKLIVLGQENLKKCFSDDAIHINTSLFYLWESKKS